MEASGVTASLRPKEVLESRHEFTEEDLELALANMACVDLIFKFQATQTDSTTQDFGVNTDADWESQVAAMFEYSVTLSDKYEKLMLKQSDEEAATELHKINLQKKKDEATRQHLALLEKLESLRVKLQLNNSKATKKNFLSKKQEMTSEKTRAEDERNRLAKELEDSERKLSSLTSEHSEEQRRWTEELEELRSEMERVRRDAQEKELIALKDEISAVERQRDTAMGHIQAWLGEVGQYLNTLRLEFPQQFPQERVKWEKQEEAVIRSKAELERRYQDVLQQLQQGRELESLPTINMPALPQVPMQRSSLEDLDDSVWSSSSFSVSTQSVWDSAASSVPSPHQRLTSIYTSRLDSPKAEVNGPIDFSELDTREPGTTTTAPTTSPPPTEANQGNTSTAPAKSSTPKPVQHPWCTVECHGRKRSRLAGERVPSSQPPMELSNHFDLLKPEDDATTVHLDDAPTTSLHPVQISIVARSDTLEANEVNGPIDFSELDTGEPGTTTIAPTTTTPPRTDANQGNASSAPAKSSTPKPRCRGRKRSTLAGERVPSSQPPMELSNHFDLLKPEDDATMVQLDDAPTTSPHPVAQLRFNQVMQTIVRPHFMPPPNQRHLHPPPPHTHPSIPNPNPHFYQPQPGHFIPPQFQHRHRFNPPPPNQSQPNINQHHFIAPAHPPPQPMRAPQIPNQPIGAQQPLQNPIRAPVQPQNPMNGSPVNPVSPSPPPATAKLDMVLEKLGARFPQCDRAQLTSLLQQVKSSRGTLAGMSMEDLMDHVNRLIQNGRSAPGPISRPTPPGPIQRPTPPPDRRALGAVALGRKPCLVCQNMVDLESRHPLSCSHTIHKDCIRMWLQTSKNNTCPFCG